MISYNELWGTQLRWIFIFGYLVFLFIVFFFFLLPLTYGEEINITKIIEIESHHNPLAYNRASGARGLMQITPVVLQEWNNYHPKEKYVSRDLFIPYVNIKIGVWYLEARIPEMLTSYNKKVTIQNILICWNAGISYIIQNKELPPQTKEFLRRYYKK